jgi:hypothetical protein
LCDVKDTTQALPPLVEAKAKLVLIRLLLLDCWQILQTSGWL